MGKRLKKIYKQEAESLRLLESQKSELTKAVEENEKLVKEVLEEESPAEVKIRQEVDELTERVGSLNTQLMKVRKAVQDYIHLSNIQQIGKLTVDHKFSTFASINHR